MPTQVLTPKFYRREDLTTIMRLRIASIALLFSLHGDITKLASKYKVSRQFIYNLRNEFKVFGEERFGEPVVVDSRGAKRKSLEHILMLRLETKSSIEGISTLLEWMDMPYRSVGFISQELERIGTLQGNVLSFEGPVLRLAICSDEVFAKNQTILMTVDPVSLAILQIELSKDRKSESWSAHWKCLKAAGYEIATLCNDEGTGMASAQREALPDTARQSDTFHAVAHRLGIWASRLEAAAFHAIEAEYECLRLCWAAKSEKVWDKRLLAYEQAQANTKTSIALSDAFIFLYHCLLEAFEVFDAQGGLKNSANVVTDFTTALDMLKALGHKEINKAVKSIESCREDLFNFLGMAKEAVGRLTGQVPDDVLKTLCLAWQTHKNAIKAKQVKRKNAMQRKEKHLIAQFASSKNEKNDEWRELVYVELNSIVRSSAAVECINSILRPYLNASKNHVTQSALNLFMAYHNHKPFRAGERKRKIPFEMLTGTIQEKGWLELMLDKAA